MFFSIMSETEDIPRNPSLLGSACKHRSKGALDQLLLFLTLLPSCSLKGKAAQGFQATGRKNRLQ